MSRQVVSSTRRLPLERIALGAVPMTGWSFADGAVRVLRSQGHTAGHVVRAKATTRHVGVEPIDRAIRADERIVRRFVEAVR